MSTTAREHIEEVTALMRSSIQDSQSKFANEVADVYRKHGPEKGRLILDRRYALRKAKRDREFQEYTISPCGCYRDPGGHP